MIADRKITPITMYSCMHFQLQFIKFLSLAFLVVYFSDFLTSMSLNLSLLSVFFSFLILSSHLISPFIILSNSPFLFSYSKIHELSPSISSILPLSLSLSYFLSKFLSLSLSLSSTVRSKYVSGGVYAASGS